MQAVFGFYDVIANIIPGILVLWTLSYTLTTLHVTIPAQVGGDAWAATVYFVFAYVLGSLIHKSSLRFGPRKWQQYGGPPSVVLMSDKSSYSKPLREAISKALNERFPEISNSSISDGAKTKELFDLAYQLVVDQKVSDRPTRFNSLYGFCRGLALCLPICSTILALNAAWQIVLIFKAQAPISSFVMPLSLAILFLAGRQISEYQAISRGRSFADSVYKSFYLWHKLGKPKGSE